MTGYQLVGWPPADTLTFLTLDDLFDGDLHSGESPQNRCYRADVWIEPVRDDAEAIP